MKKSNKLNAKITKTKNKHLALYRDFENQKQRNTSVHRQLVDANTEITHLRKKHANLKRLNNVSADSAVDPKEDHQKQQQDGASAITASAAKPKRPKSLSNKDRLEN